MWTDRMSAGTGPSAGVSMPTTATPLRNPQLSKLFGVLALIYAIWPFDLIPDFIPFLGWMDDAIALAFAGLQILRSFRPAPVPVRAGESR
jgi:uncharacterized membrane protein YkvA (DUF1232 family)